MAKFNTGQSFADGDTVTGAKLNNITSQLNVYTGVISEQTAMVATVSTADQLLIADTDNGDSGAANRVTVQKLLNDTLTNGTYTNAQLSGNLNVVQLSTLGTISSTRGTIGILNSTTGTIAGLNSTTGTVATLNSTTGTIATFNSTTGTITNLNSTTGTVATLNSTTATIPTITSITKITSGTGTAAAPAISPTGDTNTGIFFPAADTIAFAEGGTEAIRIDSSGQVGIGDSTPLALLHVSGGVFVKGAAAPAPAASATSSLSIGAASGEVEFASNGINAGNYGSYNFYSRKGDSGDSLSRMVIDSSGQVGIGETSPTGRLTIKGTGATSATFSFYVTNSTPGVQFFTRDDGLIGTGVLANSPYNFTTANAANCNIGATGFLGRSTSSIKYKKDILDSTHGLTEVLKLRPVTYKGKSEYDGSKVFGGLIAEEVHDAGLTEFVQYAEDGSPDSLSYGNMVSLAFKAIQELKAENNSLKSRIEALEAK